MKIEPNMYIRFKYDYLEYLIDKIIEIDYKASFQMCCTRPLVYFEKNMSIYLDELEALDIKTDFNIINLIEPMDLMYIDISPDDCGGIVVPRIAETLNELDKWKSRFANSICILKDVVTHEQLENGKYKIGE